ncbi:hypothetical protein FVR03_04260 [Pontibacter qinzhouensis]|uniref:Uncharacterized protein n=1 Tax=Pontibacter qinzhouensis TaxID=2603253 RepID=A0A5C8KDS5_9BACT|nr:hypothetical protein [Pontibacter qinzhouensis]TXK50873.1 hypothetical protein FVR03_04260 [Pontibacter qinzhouensis]
MVLNATEALEYQLPAGLFGRKRMLRLLPEYLEFEDNDLQPGQFSRLSKADIVDIRQEMTWIVWYRFSVGCEFKIDIQTKSKQVLEIRFRSYFSQNNASIRAFIKITDTLWEYYMQGKVDAYLHQLRQNQEVELLDVKMTQHKVAIFTDEPPVPWQELQVKQYPNFYVLYQQGQPDKHRQVYYFAWKSELLLTLIESMQEIGEDGPLAA